MTPEEARNELRELFPNQTVAATVKSFYHKDSKEAEQTYYQVYYNFTSTGCESTFGNSFEECLVELKLQREKQNAFVDKYSILLRKFSI